ncbi:glycosyltransferase [Tundrisphaera sp. TA3]|uniref:glycosyltransferase n=1 Tax=Tundrisphaera sp. TA3 TaxID=3435775 RepID=UPI003EB99FC0
MSDDHAANGTIGAPLESTEHLAEIRVLTPVSIVVPTYKEAESLPYLLERVARLRDRYGLDLELIVMDDQSNDGSVELIRDSGHDWARIVVRDGPRGLSPAVIDGLRLARHPVVVVMDADLSHPPEKIPDMILALASGQQFVIGSRYVPGGSTDDEWGFFRWLNSQVATLLARPLTAARDPMAGFFAFRRAELEKAPYLNPIGYKIGLELIVKCGLENVGEVPIQFIDRRFGQSKLSLKEQIRYLQHLLRLYAYKFSSASTAAQFAAVGLSGLIVNLSVITLMVAMGFGNNAAVACGITISLVTNFLLHRRFSFAYPRSGPFFRQFGSFALASFFGAVVNFAVTSLVARSRWAPPIQVAATIGVAAGMSFNYLATQFVVFRRRMWP